MAFRILSDEEISLFDDAQRIQYEKELEMYYHRTAFIERLEQLENARVQPYEPQLKPIAEIGRIGKPDIKSFEMAEYTIPPHNPINPINLRVKPFQKIENMTPVLPIMQESTVVRAKNIQKAKIEKLNLPMVVKPKTVTAEFGRLELIMSVMLTPAVIQPSLKKTVSLDKVKEGLTHIPDGMPNITMPSINIGSFVKPMETFPVLLAPAAVSAGARIFKMPENHFVELPDVATPAIHLNNHKVIKATEPTLPPMADISSFINREFHKPESMDIDLRKVIKPNVNISFTRKFENIAPVLPEILNINAHTKKFHKPVNSIGALPVIVKSRISKISFVMPKKRRDDLPHIADITITEKIFKKPERMKAVMVKPVTVSAPTKIFKNTVGNISRLPEITVIEVPDAMAFFKELFPEWNERQMDLKG